MPGTDRPLFATSLTSESRPAHWLASEPPLVGREREFQLLATLLVDRRLITVCGAAGSGKSVLVAEAARQWGSQRARRIVGSDLTGTTESDGVVLSIARAMGIHASLRSAVSRLEHFLGDETVLIVLDNVEHLRGSYSELLRMLDHCPGVSLLTACVTPLGLTDETLLRLQPLPVPPPDAAADELSNSPSVQLFAQRAHAIDAAFTLDTSNLDDVATACRLLDGLPLALNLAAARVRILSPRELVRHLESSKPGLDLLSRSAAAATDRHRSIRATLAWSVALLDEGQQELFATLAVFGDAFTIDAAAHVADQSLSDVLDGLSALVDACLADPLRGPTGGGTFTLLPVVREFARETLEDAGLTTRTMRRYADYLSAMARTAAEETEDCNSGDGHVSVRLHSADFVAVLDWLEEVDHASSTRLVVDLAPVVLGHAEQPLVLDRLERVIASPQQQATDAATRARVWLWSGMLLAHSPWTAELATTINDRWHRGMVIARSLPDPLLVLTGSWIGLLVSPAAGNIHEAPEIGSEACELAQQLPHPRWLSCAESLSGMAAHQVGRLSRAAELGTRAFQRARRLDYRRGIVQACLLLKTMPPEEVPVLSQLPTFVELYEICRELDDPMTTSYILAALAYEAVSDGRPVDAAAWCVKRLDLLVSLEWTHLGAMSLMHLGLVAAQLGALDKAAYFHGVVTPYLPRLSANIPPAHADAYVQRMARLREQFGAARFDQIIATSSLVSLSDATTVGRAWARKVAARRPIRRRRPRATDSGTTEQLSAREHEVLGLIAQGLSNKQIALHLTVSPKTVMHHTTAIYRKLGVRGRAEATAHAYRHNLVTD